jgi:hypothetical protein
MHEDAPIACLVREWIANIGLDLLKVLNPPSSKATEGSISHQITVRLMR